MSRAIAGWVLLLVVPSFACSALTDVVTPAPTKTTFRAVWINANWNGGRTGTPLRSQAETPPTGVGLLCPAESLLLENHVSYGPFDPTGLWITNNCNQAIFEVAVCLTAGSFGTASSIQHPAVRRGSARDAGIKSRDSPHWRRVA